MSGTQVGLGDRVAESPERNSGISWPLAVDRRLDQMLQFAVEVGERTTRKELVAALVSSYLPTEQSLADLLRTYRRSTVSQVLLDEVDGADGVVTFDPNRSGPRRSDRNERDAG